MSEATGFLARLRKKNEVKDDSSEETPPTVETQSISKEEPQKPKETKANESLNGGEEPKEERRNEPLVIVSETDAYIHDRMKSGPKNLKDVSVEINEIAEAGHILKLPKELEPYIKKYAFRWINKKKRAIDHAIDVVGWSLVNKVLFSGLPKFLFTANGSIERGDAILAFMPAKRAERIRLRPAEISRERVRNTPVQDLKRWEDRGENYYKPDLGAAENDDEKPRGIVVTPDNDIMETEV